MSKFKVGDIVQCIEASVYRELEFGKSYKVGEVDSVLNVLKLEGVKHSWCPSRFELLNTKAEKPFDMKTQPWFIRYNNEQEFNDAQEYLQKNFGKKLDCNFVSYSNVLTNSHLNGKMTGEVLHGRIENFINRLVFTEIVLKPRKEFDVEYIFPKSTKEIEIQSIEEQILALQEKKAKLQGENK